MTALSWSAGRLEENEFILCTLNGGRLTNTGYDHGIRLEARSAPSWESVLICVVGAGDVLSPAPTFLAIALTHAQLIR